MLIRRSLFSLFCVSFFCLFAQAQIATWAANSGTSTFNSAYKTTLTNDAVYISAGVNGRIYVAKYGLTGGPVWSKTIVSTSSQTTDIAVVNGYVYITGFFSGTNINFNPDGSYLLSSNGSFDAFVAKFNDADGSFVHAKNFGGATIDFAKAIEVDANNNIYITGYFTSTVNFNLSGGNNTVVNPSTLNTDMFLVKYSQPSPTVFSLQWLTAVQGTDTESANGFGMALDENNNSLFVTGNFSGTNVSFNPSMNDQKISAVGFDVFVAKYSMNNGACIQAGAISSPYADNGNDISFYNGSLYLTGNLSTNVAGTYNTNFDLNGGAANRGFTGGIGDIFLAKYNASDLSLGFAHIFGSSNISGTENGNGIKATASGVYFTGAFQGTVDFDPSGQTNNLTSAGNTDIFFAKYSSAGNFLGARRIGGSSADQGNSIDANASDDFYVAGNFSGNNIDFDPSAGTLLLTAPQTDYFVAGYSYSTVLPVRIAAFKGFVRENRIILEWQTSAEFNNAGFSVQRSNGAFWKDIGFLKGAGESNVVQHYSFTDTIQQSGNYLYRIEQLNTDGSDSFSEILKFNIEVNENIFTIFPNPAHRVLRLHFNRIKEEKTMIEVFDVNGRQLSERHVTIPGNNYTVEIPIGGLLKGMYTCRVSYADVTAHQRFLIE